MGNKESGALVDKKRILMVHNYYQIGGGEHTVFENEKNMLLKNGHVVCTYTRSNAELKKSKWKLLILPFTTIWSAKTYFEVRNLIKKNKIDVVHCHNTFPLISPSVYYAARSLKVPVLQTVHNFRFLCPNGLFYCKGQICEECLKQNSFLPALKNGCYRNSKIQTAVVAAMLSVHRAVGTYRKISYVFLTEFNRQKFEQLIDINGENVFIKPNFVNAVKPPIILSERRTQFVYAGRLDKNKGIEFLLNVWPELPEEYELHIYGDGPYRKSCETAERQYGNIRYFGFRPLHEIYADLLQSMALIFPSECYETFGMAWAESFSIGRPIVTTNVGNQAEFARISQGGTVYELGNTESFINALRDISKNNQKYSRNALQYYKEYLNMQCNYEKLNRIYEEVKHIQ